MPRKWKNYGIPYRGSKNKVITWLGENLPPGDTFVDLFCGGGSVTHYMMTQGRYRRYVINDINPMLPKAFDMAIHGGFHDENRWISREDFFRLRNTDPYAAICFSFGNNLTDYMYAQPLEPYKRACHYAVVFDNWDELQRLCPEVADSAYTALKGVHDRHLRRLRFGPAIIRKLKAIGDASLIDSNPLYRSCHTRKDTKTRPKGQICDHGSLQSLQSLESLERLAAIQNIGVGGVSLITHIGDYRSVPIPPHSTVYCDIPYIQTGAEYCEGFNHQEFYEWALNRPYPVFVSEYTMPDEFACIGECRRADSMAAMTTVRRVEKLFVQRQYADRFRRSLFAFD